MKLLSPRGLPTPLPHNPLSVVREWLEEATQLAVQPNPNAMTLATATPEGIPSARIVLCKGIELDPGYLVFVTNYLSRKGQEIDRNPHASAVIHWDDLHRQIRVEGLIIKAPPHESDALHQIRPWQSRLGAWASQQSQPVSGRDALLLQLQEQAKRFNTPPVGPDERTEDRNALVDIPRPAHWGAFHFYLNRVELWVEGEYRIHDRVCYTRQMNLTQGKCVHGEWSVHTLQP
jgi:pyridoxamine 5'-phosphate oxidase